MSAVIQMPAGQLFPGDLFRRGLRLCVVERVEFTHEKPVVVFYRRMIGGQTAADVETAALPPGEIIRRMEHA